MGFNVIKKALQQEFEARYMNYKKIDGAGCMSVSLMNFIQLIILSKKIKKD